MLKGNNKAAYGFTIQEQKSHKFGNPERERKESKKIANPWAVAPDRDHILMMPAAPIVADNNWDLQSPSPRENVKAVNANEATVNLVMEDLKMEVRQSPEGSYSDSPDKRKVKDVAKSILKHAGKSARSMKYYVLTRKGSKIRCDTDLTVESDSSFEDSIPSPIYEPEEMSSSVSDTRSEHVSGLNDSVDTADEVYEDAPESPRLKS